MIEVFLGIFWGLTYVFIIIFSFQHISEKKVFMPYFSGALNFAWEILALFASRGYWAHVIWFSLDILILFYNIYILENAKVRILYFCFVGCCIFVLYGCVFRTEMINGLLISSFVIDVIMAFEFIYALKKISSDGIILIGVCRLLGDMFAWLSNLKTSGFVMIAGSTVLCVNVFYLCYSLEVKYRVPRGKRNVHSKKKKTVH